MPLNKYKFWHIIPAAIVIGLLLFNAFNSGTPTSSSTPPAPTPTATSAALLAPDEISPTAAPSAPSEPAGTVAPHASAVPPVLPVPPPEPPATPVPTARPEPGHGNNPATSPPIAGVLPAPSPAPAPVTIPRTAALLEPPPVHPITRWYLGPTLPFTGPLPPAALPEPSDQQAPLRLFRSPVGGDFPMANLFDHDLPFQWNDKNGYQLTPWGERVQGTDGHDGYDFLTPIGTPLYAVADGMVIRAGVSSPFYCPPLAREVTDSLGVDIRVATPEGERFIASASHMSRSDVTVGERVVKGQLIGLSGQTGCATVAHVHFEIMREQTPGIVTSIDPYGWEAKQPDPWSAHQRGAPSVWLWNEGEAPPIYREAYHPAPAVSDPQAPVFITVLRWLGWRDAEHPNNEFVQLELDPSAGPGALVALGGYRIENNRGDRYVFPAGTMLGSAGPVRVFTGPGVGTGADFFWGMPGGVWDPMGDCAFLVAPNGRVVDFLSYLGAPCASP